MTPGDAVADAVLDALKEKDARIAELEQIIREALRDATPEKHEDGH